MEDGGLTLTNGTFKLSSASTITPFIANILSSPYLIPATAGLWCNGGTINTTASMWWTVGGVLRISSGTLNVGSSVDDGLQPKTNASIIVEGGNMNVAARISNTPFVWSFSMTGGRLTIGTVGNSLSGFPVFHMDQTGCSFSMSGGTMILERPGGSAGENLGYYNLATNGSGFTGGTLQIGDAATPAGDTMEIFTTLPIYNLTVNKARGSAQSDVRVNNSFTINNNNAFIINSNTLTLNGTVSGNGTITGSNTSNINVDGNTGGNIGTLKFTPANQVLNNFTLNRIGVSAQATLGTNLTIGGLTTMTGGAFVINGNTLTLSGSITGTGATFTGSSTSSLTIGGSTGGNLGTLNFTSGSQVLNALSINRSGVINSPAAVLGIGTNLVTGSLALQNGILAIGNNLFTWDHNGGTLSAPNTPFSYNTDSSIVKASFIALCDGSGNPVTATDGSKGFRINNVGNTETWFPIGYNFSSTPNRMTLQNAGTVDSYTVSLAKNDIGNTPLPRVNRIWHVSEGTTAGSSVIMKLFFVKQIAANYGISQDEIESGFNYGDIHLVHKVGNGFQNNSNLSDIQNAIGKNNGSEIYALYTIGVSKDNDGVYNGITSFSPFGVVNSEDIILPVNIINLKAYQSGSTVKVEWTSLNEVNIDHYEIERSADGIHFSTLANIRGKNFGRSLDYHYNDLQPFYSNNFYRIKAVDKDGSVTYTQIVNVRIGSIGKAAIAVYPSPVITGSFNVALSNLEKDRYNLVLYDNLGHQILNKLIDHPGGSVSQIIYLPAGIGQGVYQLLLSNGKIRFNYSIVVAK
jgi:hypothetical protein